MLYEDGVKEAVLDTLDDRVSSIADCMVALTEEGYIPNRKKTTILNWGCILIDAYQNIDVLSKEQHVEIDNLCNKIMSL